MNTVLLIHGGLWDAMDAKAFWGTTGVVDGLASHGVTVLAPDRLKRPSGWDAEVTALGEHLRNLRLPPGDSGLTIVGASNGCPVAARLAMEHPDLVERLLLAWPASSGDAAVDARTRAGLIEFGCPPEVVDGLLAGETLRGVTDAELTGLARIPVAVLPSVPENPSHQRKTVDALLRLIQGSRELAGSAEPPLPTFPAYLDQLVRTIVEFVN